MKYPIASVLVVCAGVLSGCGESTQTVPPSTSAAPLCQFHAGALPAQTLPNAAPHGGQIPIEHIIVLMQENRSFDSYFGKLPGVDGLPSNASNPDADGTPVSSFHQTKYCTKDTDHSWDGSHNEYDSGKNDGFVIQNNPDGERAIGYYDQTDLPFYYDLAKHFAIADRYFCSLLSSTYPNRFYLLAGTSAGHIHNDTGPGGFRQRSIFDALDENNISWKIYYTDAPFAIFLQVKNRVQNQAFITEFATDAAAGRLPQVTFIDPAFTPLLGPETDEHPPSNIQVGQQFVAQVINAVVDSPVWSSTALFLTYDEHGGFFDHVPPPSACVPDDIAPKLDPGDLDAQFDRYGFRVPFVLVSPYARPGYVSHKVYDHTSILRFIETRFDLPALTNRDANADPLLDLFDFAHPALINPPVLSEATIDPDRAQQCAAGS
jgi:phospholipase C